MDFVVFGFGVSALLMLGGFALRDLGPWLFGSAVDATALPEFEDAKATIRKQTLASIGNAISAAGAGVALVTVAALLGKTTDEIGAIVVGVSLVLGAVGVGAWSYDSIRRYRAAMDIVTTQENSVRTRIMARDARNRALRPEPKAAEKPQPKPAASEPETEETTTTPSPDLESQIDVREEEEVEEEEIDLDAPLPDWHDTPTTAAMVHEPQMTPAEESEPEEPDETPEITPAAASPAPTTTPRLTVTTTTTPLPTTIPPVAPLEDTLIDEAVRVESPSRLSPFGNAPSWLFDDLETDLDRRGSDQEDPIDRFREAKPVSRPSALERLLADDKNRAKNGGSSNDEEGE